MSSSDLTLRIEHDSGATSTLTVPTPVAIDNNDVTLASITIDRAIDRVARCEARVFRPDWVDVLEKVDRRNDEVFVDDDSGTTIFGGRLDDWQFESATVSLFIDSFERDALDAEPPTSFSRSATADDVIATDIINLVDAPVAAGTTDQTTSSIDFAEAHVSPGKMLRRLARDTGAEVKFRADGTADYLTSRGATKSETLDPASEALVSEPRLRQTVRENVTDVRAVSQSDDSIFESASAISVGSGGRAVFEVDRISSTSSSRLQARAARLANEFASAPEYIEVEVTLDPLALSSAVDIGDEFPVKLPAYDIDETLRIIEATRRIDGEGEQVDAILANREDTLAARGSEFIV